MNSIKKYIRFSDFSVGFLFSLAGSALFSIIEIARFSIEDFSSMVGLFFLFFFICCLFSTIPAGIGVCILGALLRNQKRRGKLTQAKAIKTGSLLAGITITIICILGLVYAVFFPHSYWFNVWDDFWQGNLIVTFPEYLYRYLNFAILHWLEILLAITIACVEGGWLGKIIANRLLAADH